MRIINQTIYNKQHLTDLPHKTLLQLAIQKKATLKKHPLKMLPYSDSNSRAAHLFALCSLSLWVPVPVRPRPVIRRDHQHVVHCYPWWCRTSCRWPTSMFRLPRHRFANGSHGCSLLYDRYSLTAAAWICMRRKWEERVTMRRGIGREWHRNVKKSVIDSNVLISHRKVTHVDRIRSTWLCHCGPPRSDVIIGTLLVTVVCCMSILPN